jgi:hypothetical protein
MRYKLFGDKLPAVTIEFNAGESIYTQSGGMTWMTDNFDMSTNVRGGLMKGLGRMLTGESLFMATYTAKQNGAEMTLASTFPGTIMVLELDGTKEYIAQKSAFLCATQGGSSPRMLTRWAQVCSAAKVSSCSVIPAAVWSSLNWMAPSWKRTLPQVNASKLIPAIWP